MKPITHLFVAGLLLLAHTLAGQMTTTLTPATVTAPVGTPVLIQLKATGFTNITSLQLPIPFNNTILQFDSISASPLPGFTAGNYPPPAICNQQGRVVVSWFADQTAFPQGFTLPANTSVYTMHFKVVGNGVQTLNLANLTSPQAPIEVVNASGQIVTVNYQNGASTITAGGGNPPPAPITGFHIIANTINIPQGDTLCMPVTVNDFDAITSMLYVMHYNTSVLQYVKTQGYNLPSLGPSNFNLITPGNLVLNWEDPTLNGVSRPDLAKIYDVCFKAIGPSGASDIINFDGNGLPPSSGTNAEVGNVNGQQLWVNPPTPNATAIKDTIFITGPATPVTFIADPVLDSISQGQAGCVDIKATNFTDVSSVKFGLTYDQNRLQVQLPIQLGSNPLGLTAGSVTSTTPGELRFTWTQPSPQTGVDLPNNSTLFSVCFLATGAPNTCSPVTFAALANPGLPIEVMKIPDGPVVPVLNHGTQCIKASLVPSLSPTVQHVTCPGGTDGSITLTVQNCVNQTFVWTGPPGFPGATTKDISSLRAGNYSVTVTCSGGATTTATITVTQPLPITVGPAQTNVTNVSCPGGANGAITLTPTGGTAPYSYGWSGPNGYTATGSAITGLVSGPYMATITDSKGCSLVTTSAVFVGTPAAITLTTTINPVGCNGAGAITNTITGGTPNFTYNWSGPGGFTATTLSISNLAVGVYSLTATDANGCSKVSGPHQVTSSGTPPSVVLAAPTTPVSCFNGANGGANITVTGGAPPYTYNWFNALNQGVANTEDVSTLAAGVYSVVVTDAAQCTQTLTGVSITGPATQLNPGIAATTPATCPGTATGAISLAASNGWGAPYTYDWPDPLPNGGSQPNVPSGTYIATVTDAGGCTATVTATVAGPAVIAYSTDPVVDHVSCAGAADGSITIAPTGGNGGTYSVMWNGQAGLTGMTISNLEGGSYVPVITDGSGCTAALPAITLTEADPITATTVPVNINGSNTGSISLTAVMGGEAPYSYSWSGPNFTSTDKDITGLTEAGTYSVTITDDAGCSTVLSETITEGNVLVNTTIEVSPSCGDNGCAIVTVPAGAMPPFTLSWTGSASGFSAPSDNNSFQVCTFAPGTYSYTISDGNNQTVNLGAEIINALAPALATSTVSNPAIDVCNGAITLTAFPVGSTMTYEWTGPNVNGSTAAALSGLCEGIYTVEITNPLSGCVSEQTIPLTPNVIVPTASAVTTQPTCAASLNGSINISVQDGNAPFTYLWSNGATTEDLIGLPAGIYTVTVTDESGNTTTNSQTLAAQSALAITNVNELSLYPGGTQVSGDGICDGSAAVVINPGSGATSILWSDGATTAQTTTLCQDYSVTVTDALGCSATWSGDLTAPAAIVVTESITSNYNGYGVSCHDECDGSAAVTVTGGKTPYTVQWPTGQIDQLVNAGQSSEETGLCGGTYQVSVTDFNNVTKVVEVIVTAPDALEVEFSSVPPNTFNNCNGEVLAEVSGGVGEIEYSWLGTYGHSGNAQRAEGLCAGEFLNFIITDENGCRIESETKVDNPADGCLQFRPVITPGEKDGKNDFLVITCIEEVKTNTVEIYNRWGQLVFETEGYSNDETSSKCWKGTNKNDQPLAEGVYYYVLRFIDVAGEEVEKKGHINLLR